MGGPLVVVLLSIMGTFNVGFLSVVLYQWGRLNELRRDHEECKRDIAVLTAKVDELSNKLMSYELRDIIPGIDESGEQ